MVLALGATVACVKEIPLPPAERDAVATAVTQAVDGTMDVMAIEKVSVARTPAYLRVALRLIPDKVPQSKNALRAHIHSTSMRVIRKVAQESPLTGIASITVEHYVSALADPEAQVKSPERVRLVYSTGVKTKTLKKHDLSTITDDDLTALVTHTLDEIRKLDIPS